MTCITIIVYFLTDTLNLQALWGKKKYLLNSLYEKLKNRVYLKNVNSNESYLFKDKQIKVKYIALSF